MSADALTFEIPEFLRRNPKGQPVTAPAPTKAPKRKRSDAYLATIRIAIPLDMSDAESLSKAIKAVQGIEKALPDGATVKVDGSLGKVAAE